MYWLEIIENSRGKLEVLPTFINMSYPTATIWYLSTVPRQYVSRPRNVYDRFFSYWPKEQIEMHIRPRVYQMICHKTPIILK